MNKIFRNGELFAAFVEIDDAVAWCESMARPGPGSTCFFILADGCPSEGWVVDTLWDDGDPGTTKTFGSYGLAEAAATNFTQQHAHCWASRIRHIGGTEASRFRLDDEGDIVLGVERVYFRD